MPNSAAAHLLLLVLGLACELIAAFFWPEVASTPPTGWRRVHFGWLGLVFFIASFISW